MKHRKSEHSESDPPCKNALNGACGQGQFKYWFTHNDSEMENQNLNVKDPEITVKMLDMMEKITQRLQLLENQFSRTQKGTNNNE